ncbi:unnamed protein product [Allacma fusca]|uniref:Integrase catalytic domain-containing protein n=1 Tax=Allacma fusca TaxID=39272 RepID=A0A8J2KQE6_9HEXA|nr:unnamed protein product [Allacma fusca]
MSVSFLRKSLKRYGVIFTCFSTRAVHLEFAPDLTTDSAVNAIRRFIARRAVPEIIWSDNGANFHGSDKELHMAVEDINKDEVTRKLASTGMTWRYNPPAAPHMGGVWERLVKSVKVALSATLKDSSPREDVRQTLLTEAEFIINNRPLTHISVDPADPRSLTPNDFLRCGRNRSFIPGDFADGKYNLRKQWQLVQVLTEKLWSRWVKEYLPTLTRRAKWLQPVKPICVGDIVVIADPNGPRNSWPLGRITEVHPEKDGQVRSVDVQTKDGVYTTPATKICVLDVTENEEDGLLQGEEL